MAQTKHYRVAGHVVLRYGAAHLVDPLTAVLRVQEDLAASRLLTAEEEAISVIGNMVRFHRGCTYRAGAWKSVGPLPLSHCCGPGVGAGRSNEPLLASTVHHKTVIPSMQD